METAEQLLWALRNAGYPVADVRIGGPRDQTSWTPIMSQGATSQQRDAAVAFLARYDPAADAAYRDFVLDTAVKRDMDEQRLISAVVWAMLDTYSAPATRAKYLVARDKILVAFKGQPWK